MFDNLPSLHAPLAAQLQGELDRYLSTDPEHVVNALAWWAERKDAYPQLSRMALDYLTIPGECIIYIPSHILNILSIATSTDVERIFSRGRLLLSHVRNRLSVQSTRALMCLGTWSELGYVRDEDVLAVTVQADLADDEMELPEDWDAI